MTAQDSWSESPLLLSRLLPPTDVAAAEKDRPAIDFDELIAALARDDEAPAVAAYLVQRAR